MAREGQTHDWANALYWTITTMSTLGYGDITFDSNAGRLFSMVVLVSGVLLILVLLPYLFIQFVVTPWIAERDQARVPRRVPDNLRGHLLLVGLDTVNRTLIARAKRTKTPTVVLVDDPAEASRLKDEGYQAMVGALDSPATNRKAGVDRARMDVSTQADTTNTNVAFTVRAVSEDVLITVTADKKASRDVLTLAGADHVVQLSSTLGTELANRILGTTGRSHIIDAIGETYVAEAATKGTALVGLTLDRAQRRIESKAQILAVMRRGRLVPLTPATTLDEGMVLIIAGTKRDLEIYDDQFQNPQQLEGPVLVLGGGRGRSRRGRKVRTIRGALHNRRTGPVAGPQPSALHRGRCGRFRCARRCRLARGLRGGDHQSRRRPQRVPDPVLSPTTPRTAGHFASQLRT